MTNKELNNNLRIKKKNTKSKYSNTWLAAKHFRSRPSSRLADLPLQLQF